MSRAVRVPVFPLAGAILFPRTQLPLHIFEPRYCDMVRDAIDGFDRDREPTFVMPSPLGTWPGVHNSQTTTPHTPARSITWSTHYTKTRISFRDRALAVTTSKSALPLLRQSPPSIAPNSTPFANGIIAMQHNNHPRNERILTGPACGLHMISTVEGDYRSD